MSTRISQRWQRLGITEKILLIFGVLLALIVLSAASSFAALTAIHQQTDAALQTSTRIERLTLEMEANLEKARRLERDFFLQYPTLGLERARQIFAQPASEHIDLVVAGSVELQDLISKSDVSAALRENDVNLAFYLGAARRYAAAFEEAVALVVRLSADETGLQGQLDQQASLLQDILRAADEAEGMALYYEMRSLEKEYFATRQRPSMQSAFNVAHTLEQAIALDSTLETAQKEQALACLAEYGRLAEAILALDVEIQSKFNEFNLQAQTVDPISEELIAQANKEVQRARAQIHQTRRLEMVVLVFIVLAALALTGVVARVFNTSVTHNVLHLSQVAREFQAGQLDARARIDSADELGQLAHNFNAMAERINALVGGLEQKVAERTAELTASITHTTRLNEELQREIAERQQAQQALKEYSLRLQDIVQERTRELQDAQEQLVQKEKLAVLGRLAGSLAHELRNPLGAIKNAAYFLNMIVEQCEPDIHAALLIMNKEVGACENIISSLLRFVRVGPPVRRNVELRRAIQEALSRVAVPENVETLLQLDDTRPIILADPRQLEQILDNLILNAVQAMTVTSSPRSNSPVALWQAQDDASSGEKVEMLQGGRLLISSQVPTPGWLDISFSDTGEGILPENLDQVFEPLFTTRARGIGLGLAIVKKLVEGHGGAVWAQSRVGEGSLFTVRLPLENEKQEYV